MAISTVRYDGFLPSGAAALTPVVRWDRGAGTLTARGTYLRFESGRRSLQGIAAASLFIPAGLRPRTWRGELSLSAGGSSYADFASFWHATAEARLHLVAPGAGRGAWIGGGGGRTSYGSAPRPVAIAGVGVWARRAGVTLAVSASRSFVGDTAYSDLGSTAHASWGRVQIDGSLATRLSSRGGGHGVYGEGSASLSLGERTALFFSGGRYPTDPVSGSVAGRYASAGVRVSTAIPRQRATRERWPPGRPPAAADGDPPSVARLELRTSPAGTRIVLHAPAAAQVELAGDFTDWQPVPLDRAGGDTWETVIVIPSGLHRLNVRIDGGPWIAPAGTTRATDEFGGTVGMVAIP